MTEDEVRVLSYFDAVEPAIASRNTFIERLRPVFDDLVARGYIEPVTRFTLTDKGEAEVNHAYGQTET